MKPLWKVKGFFDRTTWKVSDVQIVRYTWVLSLSLCLCLCLSLCLCLVSVSLSLCGVLQWWSWLWLWWWRRQRWGEGERLFEPSGCWFPSKFPSRLLKLNSFVRKAHDWRNLGHVVLDLFSNLKMCKIQGFLWRTSVWGHVRTLRELLLVCRTGDDPPPPCVDSKTPPCVHSKRTRVYPHHLRMLKHMCAWCRHTRGRFECTHGGVSESTYAFFPRFFSVPQHTHTHTAHQTHTNTLNTTQHHTQHHTETERDRERQRKKTDKEREKTEGERQDKKKQTKEDKTRRKRRSKTRQEGERRWKRRSKTRQEKRRSREEKREERKWKRRWKRRWKRSRENEER